MKLLTLVQSSVARAHVKWFAHNLDERVPRDLGGVGTFNFWCLAALSAIVIAALVYVDRRCEKWPAYKKLNARLGSLSDRAVTVLRVFTGAALLLAWQNDTIIAPELKVTAGIGWLEFVVTLLLLFKQTTAFAGLGMIAIYGFAVTQFGMFHVLDYAVYPAIGYFLWASALRDPRLHNSRLPVLYVGLGFSLCWAALEKLFFPHWGLDVLRQHPALTMGLPPDFFLLGCAFVELSLGYLLIIGLLQRPLALTVTLVILTTTAFFGKIEVIGHTILHGALLVFIILGPGTSYPPPIAFHRKHALRAVFAAVNFVLVTGFLGLAYWWMAGTT